MRDLETNLKKFAIIASLVKEINGRWTLGRTAIQKYLYLLQEVYGFDIGYEFKFYTYGPFSSEILANIDILAQIGAVKVDSVVYSSGAHGYKVTPDNLIDTIIENEPNYKDNDKLKDIISKFISSSAEDLELDATIVWVDRDLSSKAESSFKQIEDLVKQLKPKFDDSKIKEHIEKLRGYGFLKIAVGA